MTGAAHWHRDQRGHQGSRFPRADQTLNFTRIRAGPVTGQIEIIAKLVQTRAQLQHFTLTKP